MSKNIELEIKTKIIYELPFIYLVLVQDIINKNKKKAKVYY